MNKLIEVFKAKGFDYEDSEKLAEYAIKLSEILCVPTEQVQEKTLVIGRWLHDRQNKEVEI